MKINGSVSESKIRKRNGQVVDFKLDKINDAIAKAFRAVGEERIELIEFCVKQIEKDINFKGIPNVEEIQDLVERTLFRYDLFDVVKAFILYRKQHESVRDTNELFSNLNLVDDYLNLQDWRVKESANSSYSLQIPSYTVNT